MLNIDSIYSDLKFLCRKNQGGYITPSEFNRLAQLANTQYFQDLYGSPSRFRYDKPTAPKGYPSTKQVSDKLDKFMESVTTPGPVSSIPVPSDLERCDTISNTYTPAEGSSDKTVDARWVSRERFNSYRNSVIDTPTDEFPVYTREGSEYVLSPSFSTATIKYLRTPVTPVWGYTVVDNRPVYSAANSTDFEWDESDRSNILFLLASMAGITIKDGDLTNYSEAKLQQ